MRKIITHFKKDDTIFDHDERITCKIARFLSVPVNYCLLTSRRQKLPPIIVLAMSTSTGEIRLYDSKKVQLERIVYY